MGVTSRRRSWFATALLGAAMVVAVVWLMLAGRGLNIHGDEVFYIGNLVSRNGVIAPLHGLEYFFAPHNSHLVLIGRLVYSALYEIAGTHYWVFRAAELFGIVVSIGLFYVLARRRTTPAIALAFSISLLFLGYAQETFLWPFDLHTVYSLALGLGALLALEREDRRGDVLACVLLVLSVATLEVGLAFLLGVAVSVLQRDDRVRRLWIFLTPAVLYAIWWLWAKKFGQSEVHLSNVHLIPIDSVNALAAVTGSLFGLNPTGIAAETTTVTAAGTFIAGLAVVALVYRARRGGVPPTLWVSLAVLAGYWIPIALGDRPPDSSRYIFVGAMMVLLVAADAIRGMRIGTWMTVAVFVVIALAIPPNVDKMLNGRDQVRAMNEVDGAEYAMLELAGSHPPASFEPTLEPLVQEAGGSVDAQLDAGQYREVLGKYGSLASSLGSVEAAAEPIRAVADATLVRALDLQLKPTAAPADLGACDEVAGATPEKVGYFALEPGGVVLGAPAAGGEVSVSLSRFTGGLPAVPIGTLAPGEWAEVRIPTDSSAVPWKAAVDGPVQTCPTGAGG